MAQTHTQEVPKRITSHHYVIRSSSRKGVARYNLTYNIQLKRWTCDCPDACPREDENGPLYKANPNCKHVRRLREHIQSCKDLQEETDLLQRVEQLERYELDTRDRIGVLSEIQDTHMQDTEEELHRLRNYCIRLEGAINQISVPQKIEINPIRNDYGRIVAVQLGSLIIQVSGRVSGNCSCGKTTSRKLCEHIAQVDAWLQSAELVVK